jgi:hypothetical protein
VRARAPGSNGSLIAVISDLLLVRRGVDSPSLTSYWSSSTQTSVGIEDDRKAVCARGAPGSNGSLIAVSYEARKAGVKRNMRAIAARQVCPELQLVQVRVSGSACAGVLVRVCRCLCPGVRVSELWCTGVWVQVCRCLGPGVRVSRSGCAGV